MNSSLNGIALMAGVISVSEDMQALIE